MENPHAERQAVLLERILKNTVRICNIIPTRRPLIGSAVEMYGNGTGTQSLHGGRPRVPPV